MNGIARYDARTEIHTDLSAAIALARPEKKEQTIDLLSRTAGSLAILSYAEILGASMKIAECLQMFMQRRHIDSIRGSGALKACGDDLYHVLDEVHYAFLRGVYLRQNTPRAGADLWHAWCSYPDIEYFTHGSSLREHLGISCRNAGKMASSRMLLGNCNATRRYLHSHVLYH